MSKKGEAMTKDDVARIWANKVISSRTVMPVPGFDPERAAERAGESQAAQTIDLANSAVDTWARSEGIDLQGEQHLQIRDGLIEEMARLIQNYVIDAANAQVIADRVALASIGG